jgi:pimeloyl-ACP methyl ester carboxylesterase
MPTDHPAGSIDRVHEAFRSMADRYLGAEAGFDATFHIRLADIGHTWEVRCTQHVARVRHGITSRAPDVVIGTDAATWLDLRQGDVVGVEAFRRRRLYARGDLDLAVGFEGMFRLPNGRPPLQRIHHVPVGGHRISTLTMGDGRQDVVLVHGLGATKSSFFDTAAALSRHYRVHAIDLLGFGGSSKPLMTQYGPRMQARTVAGVMDVLGIDRAHIVGHSMGGRVSIELALTWPERVGGLALLCPAVAFVRRGWHPVVRVLRPELALMPHTITREMIEHAFWSMFADRDQLDPSVADIAMDEFARSYKSAGARRALLASARGIYLEKPFGVKGFYPRIAALERPVLFVWGTQDRLIPVGFKPHVEKWLPQAEQVVLQGCGHVPQVERPEHTNAVIRRFLARVDALGAPPATRSRTRRRRRAVQAA